jgi:hypothetical protein
MTIFEMTIAVVVLVLSLHQDYIFFNAFRIDKKLCLQKLECTCIYFNKKYSCPDTVGQESGKLYKAIHIICRELLSNYGEEQKICLHINSLHS